MVFLNVHINVSFTHQMDGHSVVIRNVERDPASVARLNIVIKRCNADNQFLDDDMKVTDGCLSSVCV